MNVEVTRYGSEKDGLVPFQSPGGFWATVTIVVSLSGIAAFVAFRSTRT